MVECIVVGIILVLFVNYPRKRFEVRALHLGRPILTRKFFLRKNASEYADKLRRLDMRITVQEIQND